MSFFHLPKWVIQAINLIRRAFFWKGAEEIHGEFGLLIDNKCVCIKNKEAWFFAIFKF